jgi:DNA recombination protein RmuC
MMEFVYLLAGVILASIVAYIFTRQKNIVPVNSDDAILIQNLQKEIAVLEEKYKQEVLSSEKYIQEFKNQISGLTSELKDERNKLAEANQSLERSRTYYKAQEEKIQEQKQQINELQEKLTKDFENIANKILTENSSKFTEQNKTNLDGILNPLKERIKDFEEKVDKAYKSESAERNTLKGTIEQLMQLNKQISIEATNLTNALKGDTKTQGNWGEFVLEKILESSGLVENENYTLQGKGMGLVDDEGNRFQPDVVINLPEEKHLIIDSKVSLVAYEKLLSADSELDREKYIKEHVNSIRAHIQSLSNKNYQNLYGINSPDFVLLFIPIESSFSVATQYDKDLFEFAWTKRIVLVSPSTLLATLKTVASVWKQEKQTKNAIDIANKAGLLYDKFYGFVEDLKKIGVNLDKAKESYEQASNKLHEGKGSLTSRVESLKKLGAKTQKQIDKSLIEDNSQEEDEE